MSRNSPKTSAFRLDRALDFIYDANCVIPPSERRRHEELALLQPMTKKIVLNYRSAQYGSSLVDAMSIGSDVLSSVKQTIKSDQTTKLSPADSSAVMQAHSPVVRAQFVADVAGINRYKYFHRPLNSTQSIRPTSVPITNFQIKPDNIDKKVNDAAPHITHRNSEPGESTSSGYHSLKSSNESRSTATSDISARRVNRRRAARLLLQKSLIDRLHYSHTSRSTIRSTEDTPNCGRCWRHASPSQSSLELLDDKLFGKSTSLPTLNARGASLGSEKRRKNISARKLVRNASISPSADRLPRTHSQAAKKKYPQIVVKEASVDETAVALLQKYDQIRADLDKKMEQISLKKGANRTRKIVPAGMASTTSPLTPMRALNALKEDVEGVMRNNDAAVEEHEEAGVEAAPQVDFSDPAESAVIGDDSVFSETAHSENNGENQALIEESEVDMVFPPDALIEEEEHPKPEDGILDDHAQSDSRTSSEASQKSVIKAEQIKADESEIMSNGEKSNENDPPTTGQFAAAPIYITISDESQTQLVAKQDAETCTDDMELDEKDTQTETDSTVDEEQTLDDELAAPKTVMRATQTVLVRENGELEEFEFIKTQVRGDLNALIEAALHETVDCYSRHRANEQFAQHIKRHAEAWKDVKTFVGSTLLPESILLAMREAMSATSNSDNAQAQSSD